jgi:chemotaxis protein methyltransferase CheR
MNERDRRLVVQLCAARTGLDVDPDRAYLIESRLAPVARREGFTSVTDLVHAVRDRGEERLIWTLVEAMSPPDTAFFRDQAMFRALREQVTPELMSRRPGARLRFWSAACGTGQEAYSLAMLLAQVPGASYELVASDLNERALEKAKSGVYSQFEVQRGLPAAQLVRNFEKREELFVLSPDLRRAVDWRRVNLLDDLSPLGQFDVVVCARVLGGLTEAARARVLAGLAGALAPGGYLVTGADTAALGGRFTALPDVPGGYTLRAGARVAA